MLRNGPEGTWETPAYSGTQACNLEGSRPNQSGGKMPTTLEVRTSVSERYYREKLILIRFKDLPKLGRPEKLPRLS